ncbi:MAG: signal peptide peptidase SppA [Planctomycetota bacterium]
MSRRLLALLLLVPVAVAQGPEPAAEGNVAHLAELKVRLDETEDPYPAFPLGPSRANYYGLLKAIRQAARDAKVDGVILKPDRYAIGWARLLEVRAALQELRRSGKKVFVYMESFGAPDLVLASVADRISLPESGVVFLPGLGIESWYVRELLAKLRVRFDVIHIGEYKSAGESLVRDAMSPELRETLDPLLDEIYGSMADSIAEGRRLSPEAVRAAIDKGLFTAREAQSAGLVDRVEYQDQFNDGVKALFPGKKVKIIRNYPEGKKGPGLDPDNPMAAFTMLFSALVGGSKEERPEGPKVAIVYCSGPILSGKSQYDWQGNVAAMGSETVVEAIDAAGKADDVKAIVLRINSPGGSGLASDMIWRAVARVKEKKPVIASMGDVAASGGYYIAMNSTAIVAEPQTITGSIGVVGIVPNADDLFPWIGIKPERLTRGKRAEGFATTKGLSEEDKETLRLFMKSFYDDFVAKVAAGRGRTPAEIEPIARGRVWTGRKAQELGLVDRIGGLEDAIALAREKGGIAADADFHVLESPRRAGPFELLQDMFETGAGIDQLAAARVPALRRALVQIASLRRMGADRVCAVVPELSALQTACSTTNR